MNRTSIGCSFFVFIKPKRGWCVCIEYTRHAKGNARGGRKETEACEKHKVRKISDGRGKWVVWGTIVSIKGILKGQTRVFWVGSGHHGHVWHNSIYWCRPPLLCYRRKVGVAGMDQYSASLNCLQSAPTFRESIKWPTTSYKCAAEAVSIETVVRVWGYQFILLVSLGLPAMIDGLMPISARK